MTLNQDKDRAAATPELSGVAAAGRSARRNFGPVPLDEDAGKDEDISVIHVGYTLTNKFAFSAKAQVFSTAQMEKEQQQAKAKSKDQQELERLAAWSAKLVTVGGVQMTNGEAQLARRGVMNNADHYAEWAVAQGHIRPEDKEKFKETVHRKHELEDKRGRDTITAAEDLEVRRIDQSRMGSAVNAATVHDHQHDGVLPPLKSSKQAAETSYVSTIDKPSFKDAPALTNVFAAAHSGPVESEKKPTQTIIPPSPEVSATGFAL